MGESTNPRAKLRFDRRIRLEFHGATITSDAGLLACRELDDALGLTETTDECLQESRGGRNVQHRLVGLLRQSVYSRLAGYEDTNDAERLAQDPTMRVIVGRRGGPERPAASTNTMSRFETEVLTQDADSKARAAAKGRAEERFSDALVIEESKRFGLPLDARDTDGRNRSRTAHGQILRYLSTAESETDGDLHWGFLTNGGVWRLYDYRARPRATAYFEADLGGMLESGDDDRLRVFYLLFRRDSFVLRDGAVATFLNGALAEGRRYEEQVAQDLSSVVFEKVFPKLVEALADASGESLPDVRHAALIFLYRLFFVLYAEDRGLLPVNDSRYDDYGLRKRVRDDIRDRTRKQDAFSAVVTHYYDHLMNLCRIIDGGDESIGLPPYNGGLFAEEAAPLLERVRLPDAVVAPIMYDLSHAELKGQRRFVNYRDMSVQQLGSIYEHLLEQEPVRDDDGRIAVRPNSYARKDSGSFFTPQELVDLIVDRTLKPLAEERLTAFEARSVELKRDRRPKPERLAELHKLDPAEAVLDLKVLDPAMGSGHFLVTAVDFLSDYIAELVEYVPAIPEWLDGEYESPLVRRVEAIREDILRRACESEWVIDESLLTDQAIIRRMILKRCIYGVDKNPLTVELAKVSLWLHSFTVGAPLSFLDHHLRCGDSLIGMRVQGSIEELLRLSGLFASSAIQHAENATAGMQLIEEMSDADVAEVRESAALFREVEATTATMRGLLDFLCGLRWLTAGMKRRERTEYESPLVDFLEQHSQDAYRLLSLGPGSVDAVSPGSEETSASEFEALWSDARTVADRERFLHWEVAFRGVWHGWQDVRPRGGFDAVIGNPPWDRIKLQEVEWFATRAPGLALAPTAAARKEGILRLRNQGAPLVDEYDEAKERADRLGQLVRASGDYPLLGGGRHKPLLVVRRACHGPRQAGRVRGTAHAVRHLRRQDGGTVLPVGLDDRAGRGPVRLREQAAWDRAPTLLPRCGRSVQVLRPRPRRRGTTFRRDRVRVLPPRLGHHQGPRTMLPARPRRLRAGEPEHGYRTRLPHSTRRGDHPTHLRAAPGTGGSLARWGAPSVACAVRADARYGQRFSSL